jgi:hypothetical protein
MSRFVRLIRPEPEWLRRGRHLAAACTPAHRSCRRSNSSQHMAPSLPLVQAGSFRLVVLAIHRDQTSTHLVRSRSGGAIQTGSIGFRYGNHGIW